MQNGVGLERFGFGRFGRWLWRLGRGTGAHSEVNEAGKKEEEEEEDRGCTTLWEPLWTEGTCIVW